MTTSETRQSNWHMMTADEALARLGADVETGLSIEAVDRARATHGRNVLPEPTRPSAWRQFLSQLVNPLVGTLLAAAVVAVVVAQYEPNAERSSGLAKYGDAVAILLIVVVNAIIGFIQERKAEKALDALQKMAAPRCRVRRAGQRLVIEASELVPGDIVDLAEGDQLPADVRLVETASFDTIEGALTGESTSVHKEARKVCDPGVVDSDKVNMAFMGTTAVRGHAVGVVVATGSDTLLGRIGKLLAGSEKPKSPLEERLEDFGHKILILCGVISAVLFAIGIVQGGKWYELLLVAVSVAVAAIPEGLPAITTITLALGMQRMARHNAIVRKLPAVETLGSVGVICSDKTGTLTRNEMTVRALWTDEQELDVTGLGYDRVGRLVPIGSGEPLNTLPHAVQRAIAIGVVSNTASVEYEGEIGRGTGDPTEIALLVLGEKTGLPRAKGVDGAQIALHLPFDSDRKRMTVALQAGERVALHTKGAADCVLPLCSQILGAGGPRPLDSHARGRVEAAIEELSSRALRVLALAERHGGPELLGPPGDNGDLDETGDAARIAHVEDDLTLVGLVGLLDPPREEVKLAIAECRRAGIRVVMITGDHRLTAEAIARDLGLWDEGDIGMTGEELESTSDEALRDKAPHVRVFARVSPEHKLLIVRALQAPPRCEVAAMTGDGVNDAPAIRESAIGVAMGKNGTDVARQAADIVLADDNFATIVEAVREGRAIFQNIQKSIYFLLSSNAGLVITVFATSFFDDMPPLSPIQILWINLVTNGLPALALGVDPPEADQMKEPPRTPGTPFLGRREWRDIGLVGLFMGAAALAIYLLPLWPTTGPGAVTHEEARLSKLTLVFTVLALSPLFHAFNCRSLHSPIFGRGLGTNRFLWLAVGASALVHLLALVVPPLQPVFHSGHSWTLAEVALVLGLSALPIPVVEIAKRVSGRMRAAREG